MYELQSDLERARNDICNHIANSADIIQTFRDYKNKNKISTYVRGTGVILTVRTYMRKGLSYSTSFKFWDIAEDHITMSFKFETYKSVNRLLREHKLYIKNLQRQISIIDKILKEKK